MSRERKKKKIVFYIGSLGKGGAERVIVNLTEAMLRKGHEVLLVTSVKLEEEYPLPKGARRIITYEDSTVLGKNRVKNFLKRFGIQRGIWKREAPDIIVSFIGKNNVMALLTTLGLSLPVLVCVRGEPGEEYFNRPLQLCAKYLFPRAAGVVLQTEDSKEFFSEKVRKKAVVLANPLSPVFVQGKEADIHLKEDGFGEKRRITMVGRIDANKNQRMVIEAFSRVADRFCQYNLEIWGNGEERENLRLLVSDLGLEERVLLPGVTRDVQGKLKESSIYILSSNTEGMPNALMEAMAMGLPVISTDCPCGGPRTLIQNQKNGLLVPVNDIDAMTAAMQRLMEDEELALRLGKQALEIRKDLHPDRVNEQWEGYILSKIRQEKK